MVLEPPAGSREPGVALGGSGTRPAAAAVAAARPSHEKTPAAHAGRDRVPVRLRRAGAVAGASRASLCVQGGPYGSGGALRAGRSRVAAVRRQFQLARADLVSNEFTHRRKPAKISSLLRQ